LVVKIIVPVRLAWLELGLGTNLLGTGLAADY
jgi:hypothetical protein